MNIATLKTNLRQAALLPCALALLLLSGCLEQHLVWSPDGQRAAVIAKGKPEEANGLYLCDAEGKLTARLAPDVYRVAWLSDSQQLVVARAKAVGEWTPIARALGAERAAATIAQAEDVWKKLETGADWNLLKHASFHTGTEAEILKIYLRERYGEALHAKVGDTEWTDLKSKRVDIHELLMAKLVGDGVQLGTTLYEGLSEIQDIRIAPGDRAVAFTEEFMGNDKKSRLLLTRINGTGATLVAEDTNLFPDWTADGRSLVYVQALGGGSKKDDLRLASVVRREVLGADGQIKSAENTKDFMGFKEKAENIEDLAGLMFQNSSRVRCLRDGRILFNAFEFNLPLANKDADAERERLFVLDPARYATLVRAIPRDHEKHMPKVLSFFEPSPDERQVLVGGYSGEISVLTLATGEVDEVQKEGEQNLMMAPVWRPSGEITYAKRNPSAADGKNPDRKAEIVLRQGAKEKILSQSWSDQMLEAVFPGSDNKK